MAFNHYAKMKRILNDYPGWYILQINDPTESKTFKGEVKKFDPYYRVCASNGEFIKFCKFQQIELFAKTMGMPAEALPVAQDT